MMVLALLLTVQGLAWGGFDEGVAAYKADDYATALREWRPLAEQGHVKAQWFLGVMYYNGWGVPRNYKKSTEYYRMAAKQGHTGAQWLLGYMYDNGWGVPQDYIQANKWYIIAGANGQRAGATFSDMTAKKMTTTQIAEAKRLAREWMEKHP